MKKRILTLAMLVALVGVMVMPMAALADTLEGVTDVGGNMPADVLEVAAPGGITLGSLYGTADNVTGTSDITGNVTCTCEYGYTLKLSSDQTDGKLHLVSENLTYPLGVTAALEQGSGAASVTTTWVAYTAATTDLVAVGGTTSSAPEADGKNIITLSVTQRPQVTGTAGDYSLTLTWTVAYKSP